MRKVIHLTSVHTATDTRIFYREARTLERAGYDVVLICPGESNATVDGVSIRTFTPARSRISRMTFGVWRAFRAAIAEGPAVVHVHDPELLTIVPLLRICGRPVIYDAHEVLVHQVAAKGWIPKPIRPAISWFAWLLERVTEVSCSAIVAATEDIALRYRRGDVTIVRNFPDADELAPAAATKYSERPMGVAYVGGITRVRGGDEMVLAVGSLDRKLGALLYLAGEFQPADYRHHLERLQGWTSTRALGRLNRAEVVRILSVARVGLVVLHPTESYLRSLPIKLFEYMAAGMPVVASHFPLWQELLGPYGCVTFVDPTDIGQIAAAIEARLRDTPGSEAMAARGLAAVHQTFSWNAEAARLINLYRRILGSGSTD